jgi:hypothetical protein
VCSKQRSPARGRTGRPASVRAWAVIGGLLAPLVLLALFRLGDELAALPGQLSERLGAQGGAVVLVLGVVLLLKLPLILVAVSEARAQPADPEAGE